jgi:hypothetical protein
MVGRDRATQETRGEAVCFCSSEMTWFGLGKLMGSCRFSRVG